MKKKRIIIIGVIVGILLLIGGGLFYYFKADKDKTKSKEYYGAVSNVVVDYQIISLSNDYALIKKDGLYGVIDSKGKIIIEPTLKNVTYLNAEISNKFLELYIEDSDMLIYNTKGEKKLEIGYFSFFGEDLITGKEYFNGPDFIYDDELNSVFNTKDVYASTIVDNKIYYTIGYDNYDKQSSVYVYDLKSKSKLDIKYDEIMTTDEYFYALGEKSLVINLATKDIKEYGKGYIDGQNEKIIINDGDNSIYYDFYGNKYSGSELTIRRFKSGLYQDKKDCEYGAKLYDKSGKVISDSCNYYNEINNYVFEHDWKTNSFIKAYDKNGKAVIEVKNDDIQYTSIWNDNNYIYYSETFNDDKTITTVYDYDLNKYSPCKDNESVVGNATNKNLFVCSNNHDYYFADKEGQMLSDKYEYIECNQDGLCLITNGAEEGLFYYNKFVVDLSSKYNIEISQKTAMVQQLAKTNIIRFDKVNSTSKLLKEVKIEDEKITLKDSVDDIIKEYNLEFEKEEIYANKDFFTKYAYVVFNNIQKEYNKYVFDIFKTIIDNKSLLNENAFLRELRKLNFKLVNQMEYGIGTFSPGSNRVSLFVLEDYPLEVSSVEDSTIYHELMHFVDYTMNTAQEYVYNCNGKYYSENDVKDKTSCTELYLAKSSLLVEAGAEFFASSYYNNYDVKSYDNGVAVYIILEYLFGEKEMQKAFFSSNTETELFKLLVLKGGLSFEEFNDFLTYGDNIVYENVYEWYIEDADIAYSKIVDLLIKLYENLNGASWKDSYEFRLYLSQMFGIEGYTTYDESAKNRIASSKNKVDLENYLISLNRYMNGDTIKIDIEKEIGLITDPDANPNHMVVNMIFRIVNNKPTVVIPYELIKWGSNGGGHPIEKGTYVVNYDFENKKVIDFKQVYKEEIKDN